jgi:hypothetical protein
MSATKEQKSNKKNILQSLSKAYFQGIADDISNAKMISSIFSNMGDVGDIRENILLKFLQTHLPLRCAVVKGGCIFNSEAVESKQIDLLIVNDSSLRFSYFDRDSQNSKNIQTVEGCLVAISVKSTLDKTQLFDALQNISTIPKMPNEMLEKVSPSLTSREHYLTFPLKIVFAFSGTSPETTLTHVNDYYMNNLLEEHQKADLIVVNNSFCIEKISKGGMRTRNGSLIPEGTYHPTFNANSGTKFGAYPLFRLLIKIQATTLWAPHVMLTYDNYLNAMEFH